MRSLAFWGVGPAAESDTSVRREEVNPLGGRSRALIHRAAAHFDTPHAVATALTEPPGTVIITARFLVRPSRLDE